MQGSDAQADASSDILCLHARVAPASIQCKRGDPAHGPANAALVQPRIRLVPDPHESSPDPMFWHDADVEIPASLASRLRDESCTHLVLLIGTDECPLESDHLALGESRHTPRHRRDDEQSHGPDEAMPGRGSRRGSTPEPPSHRNAAARCLSALAPAEQPCVLQEPTAPPRDDPERTIAEKHAGVRDTEIGEQNSNLREHGRGGPSSVQTRTG